MFICCVIKSNLRERQESKFQTVIEYDRSKVTVSIESQLHINIKIMILYL